MSEPIKLANKPLVSGYVGVQVGGLSNVSHEPISTSGIKAGIKVEQNGWFANADGGYGGSTELNAEVGKSFKLTKNINFTSSIGARHLESNKYRNYFVKIFEEGDSGPEWKKNHDEVYFKAGFDGKTKSGFVWNIGAKASKEKSVLPSLEGVLLPDIGQVRSTEYAGTNTKIKLRPIFGIGYDFGKNDNWRVALNGSTNEFNVGLRCNF